MTLWYERYNVNILNMHRLINNAEDDLNFFKLYLSGFIACLATSLEYTRMGSD